MKVTDTPLQGLKLIEPDVIADHRGFFMESYNETKYAKYGITTRFVQDNHALSVEAGVLRGLHYQLNPKAQSKLVRVTRGAVLDVVVDIRIGSPTFGQWRSFVLSAANHRQLFVPKGFAHGYCTLEPNSEVQYKVDEAYAPVYDRGIRWDDPMLNIDWPTVSPILSDKDRGLPELDDAENNFHYEG